MSPLFHADKIVNSLIVLQGANDPRVIKPESDEIVDNIKKRNGVVEYVFVRQRRARLHQKGERDPHTKRSSIFLIDTRRMGML